MKDKEFEEAMKNCTGADFWINEGLETNAQHMYKDLLFDIRNSILLLAEVIQTKDTYSGV